MTEINIIDLLTSFVIGAALSSLIWFWIHRTHKKAWHAEFRRLMGGISRALFSLSSPVGVNYREEATNALRKLFNGEK